MTVKQFFKSNAFKCIIVLFAILIICGALLTAAYGFMEVSAGERLQRAVGKIYPGESVVIYGDEDKVIDENETSPKSLISEVVEYDDSEILSAYRITFTEKDDVHYLVQSKGLDGYSGGSVTCWVAVNVDEAQKSIKNIAKVSVGESAGQTFMNKITGDMLTSYTTAQNPTDGFYTTDGYVSSGASLSSRAINNSVNGAVRYVNLVSLGNSNQNFYDTLELKAQINTQRTSATVSGSDVTYSITTKGSGGSNAFTVTVVVGADAKIKSYSVVDGSTGKYSLPATIKSESFFVGKGIEYFTAIYGENLAYAPTTESNGEIVTGATSDEFASNSVYQCMCAGAFATKNYGAVYTHLTGGAK